VSAAREFDSAFINGAFIEAATGAAVGSIRDSENTSSVGLIEEGASGASIACVVGVSCESIALSLVAAVTEIDAIRTAVANIFLDVDKEYIFVSIVFIGNLQLTLNT
jgi:hypothetical protein